MKNMYKLFLGAAIFAVLSVNTFAQIPVAVINNGWEDGLKGASTHGAYGGWFYESNNGASTTFEIVTNDVQKGLNALKVTTVDTGTNDWSSQIFNRSWEVDSAKAYRLSMWFKNTGATPMRASFTSGHGRTYNEYGRINKRVLSNEWKQMILFIQVPFTTDTIKANPDYISMSTHFLGANTSCLVDNFEVFEEVSSATFDGNKVTLTFYDELVQPKAGAEVAFAAFVGNDSYDATAISVNGKVVVLTLSDALANDAQAEIEFSGQVLSLAYNTTDTAILAPFGIPMVYKALSNINEVTYSPISFYPNPASDFINFANSYQINKIQFIDITGKSVKTVEGTMINSVSIGDLNKGLYFMMINSENGKNYSGRLIVK